MSKRASLKGRGVDIFTNPEESEQKTSTPARQHTGKPEQLIKSTFYLEAGAVEKLEKFWLDLRIKAKGKKISKSHIVSQALIKTIEDLKGQPLEKVLTHFD